MTLFSESYVRFLRKSLLLIFAVFALLTVSSIISSAPAQAASATCPGPCINTAIDVAIHGSSSGSGNLGGSGSGSSGGSGGGTSAPPVVRTICQPDNTNYCIQTPITSTQWVPAAALGLPGPCPAKQVNGFTINYAGMFKVTVYNFTGWIGQGSASWSTTVTNVCIYPPDPVVDTTRYDCIVSWNATVNRLANSYSGAAGVASNSGTTAFANGGMKDSASCETRKSAALNYAPPSGQPGWGQYRANSSIVFVSCTKATTTVSGVITNMIKCGGPQTKNAPTTYLTVWCGGYSPSLLDKKWSGEDCYSAGVATCTAPGGTTFNGFTGNVQALRDGNDGIVQWANPIFSGNVRNVNSWQVKTDVNSGSTPYKLGVSANDKNNQLFRSDANFGIWKGGDLSTLQRQTLAFYTAGDSGSPFSMTRNYTYNAEFLTHDVVLNQIDLTTGRISASTVDHWNPVVKSACGPQRSPNINAVRAIGDVITH